MLLCVDSMTIDENEDWEGGTAVGNEYDFSEGMTKKRMKWL